MTILKSTGNPDIDKAHETMARMMYSIIRHTENGHSVEELKKELLNLYAVAEEHFKDEEELMHEIDYQFTPTHIMAHEDILSKIRIFLEILEHSKKDYNVLVSTLLKVIEKHVEHYDVALFLYNEHHWESKQAGIQGQGASGSLPS